MGITAAIGASIAGDAAAVAVPSILTTAGAVGIGSGLAATAAGAAGIGMAASAFPSLLTTAGGLGEAIGGGGFASALGGAAGGLGGLADAFGGASGAMSDVGGMASSFSPGIGNIGSYVASTSPTGAMTYAAPAASYASSPAASSIGAGIGDIPSSSGLGSLIDTAKSVYNSPFVQDAKNVGNIVSDAEKVKNMINPPTQQPQPSYSNQFVPYSANSVAAKSGLGHSFGNYATI